MDLFSAYSPINCKLDFAAIVYLFKSCKIFQIVVVLKLIIIQKFKKVKKTLKPITKRQGKVNQCLNHPHNLITQKQSTSQGSN